MSYSEDQLLGAVGMSTMVVRAADTSVAAGINELPVLAASAATSLVESACSAALAEFCAPGETSFTQSLNLEMLTSVPIGEEVRAHVRLIAVDDHLVVAFARSGIAGGEAAAGFERGLQPQTRQVQHAQRAGDSGTDQRNNRIHSFCVFC